MQPFFTTLDRLPSVIALPLADYLQEDSDSQPVLKLWHSCDVIEMTLRLLVMVGIADLRRHGPLPASLLNDLRARIEEPTLGKWRGMAGAVAEEITRTSSAVPELPGFVQQALVPLLDGPREAYPSSDPGARRTVRTAENSFSQLRNRLAHGGGMTRVVGARLLKMWEGPFREAMSNADWLMDLDLVIRDASGVFGILRGPVPRAALYTPRPDIDLSDSLREENEVVVIRDRHILRIWPLGLYGLPRSLDSESVQPEQPAPQAYVRRGEVSLHFTPVGSAEVCQSIGNSRSMDEFRKLFQLDAVADVGVNLFVVPGFERDLQKDAAQLVGRAAQLDTLRRLLAENPQGVSRRGTNCSRSWPGRRAVLQRSRLSGL
ncbi:MAG TPA: hypothetical protein VK395_05570 [Gemmataceae bacterium]|nr:hypothetical protein [Gemmataceae bacterium]